MCTNFLLQTAICVTYRQFVQKLDHPRLVFLDKWVYHFHERLLQRDQAYVLAYQLAHSERLSSFLQMQFIKWSRISFDLTLIPNSTKFAKFCNAFAISFKVRQATSDGVSGRHGKNIQMYLSVSEEEYLAKKWNTNIKQDTKGNYTCD